MIHIKRWLMLFLCVCIMVTPFAGITVYAEEALEDGSVSTVSQEGTPEPTATVEAEGTPEPTATVEAEGTPEPTATVEAEGMPEPTVTAEAEDTPEPTATVEAEGTPEPNVTVEAEGTPEPTATAAPDETSEPEGTVEPDNTVDPDDGDARQIILVPGTDIYKTGNEIVIAASGLDEGTVYTYELVRDETVVDSGETDSLIAFTVYSSGLYVLNVSAGNISASLDIEVAPTAPSKIDVKAVKIGLKEKYAIEVILEPWYAETVFTYKSSSTKYVKVDSFGFVTGVRRGSAYITVKTANGLSDKAKVTVVKAPTYVKMTADRNVLGVGESAQLSRTLPSGSYSKYWQLDIVETSAPDVIALSGVGVVTAVNPGTATVRLTIYNGLTADLKFTVYPAPEGITLPETAIASAAGPAIPLAAVLTEGSYGKVTYASSDRAIATVDANGNVKGLKAGNVLITATTYNGYAAECALTVLPAPTKLTLNYSTITVGVGETFKLEGTLTPADAQSALRFKTGNKRYATVSADGTVKALRKGTVYIYAYTYNNKSAKCKIVVQSAPSKVTLNASNVTLGYDAGQGLGESYKLKATLPKYTASRGLVWSISAQSDEGVVALDTNGNITATGIGWADITVTTHNGKTDTCRINVMPATTAISFDATETVKLGAGRSLQLKPVTDEGSAGRISYETSDAAIATVSSAGVVKGIRAGDVVITARTFNGHEAEIAIAVLPAPTKLKLNYSTITVGVGETFELTGTLTPAEAESELRFKTSSSRYATVSSDGIVTAKRKGTVYIYAYTYNNKSAKCKVIVRSAPGKVTLNASNVTLGYDAEQSLGESYKLKATLPKYTASRELSWSISAQSSEGIVSVDAYGNVIATGIGWAEITVTTHNGKTAKCRFTVLPATKTMAISPVSTDIIGIGQQIRISPLTDEGSAGRISFSCTPAGIVRVDGNGYVKGLKHGIAEVTATSFNGCSASVTIEVVPAPSKITVPSRNITLGVGDTYVIEPSIPEGTMAQISYSTSRKYVATVSSSGTVKAIKKGTSTITVRTHNGKKTTVYVTVKAAPSSVAFKKDEVVLHPGDVVRPGVNITKYSVATYTYSTDAEEVASISSNGTITANAVGETIVHVKTHNGKTDTMKVRVVEPPYEIIYNGATPEKTALGVLEELPVSIVTESGNPYEGIVTVTSSNTSVLRVNSTHMLGNKKGTATVTVKAGGLSSSFNVQVVGYSSIFNPEIVAHRGNGMGYPENSLEAIMSAAETGATWVEIDIRRTADGVIVLCHDATVDRTSNGTGKVAEMTYAELLALDFEGTQIRTLEEVVAALAPTDVNLWLEFKVEGVADEAVSIVNSYGMRERTVYNSYLHNEIFDVMTADPDALSALTYHAKNWDVDKAIKTALQHGIYAVYPGYSIISETEAAKVHAKGIKVAVYTVNTQAGHAKCMGTGVDFVITDKPGFMYELTY